MNDIFGRGRLHTAGKFICALSCTDSVEESPAISAECVTMRSATYACTFATHLDKS
jgi:hypothetical protein